MILNIYYNYNKTSQQTPNQLLIFFEFDWPAENYLYFAIQLVNECCNYEEDGADCTVCSCDTDDCNGASMTQISTLCFIAVVLLSFMSQ